MMYFKGGIRLSEHTVTLISALAEFPPGALETNPGDRVEVETLLFAALGCEIAYIHGTTGKHACAAELQENIDHAAMEIHAERPDLCLYFTERRALVRAAQAARSHIEEAPGRKVITKVIKVAPIMPPGMAHPERN